MVEPYFTFSFPLSLAFVCISGDVRSCLVKLDLDYRLRVVHVCESRGDMSLKSMEVQSNPDMFFELMFVELLGPIYRKNPMNSCGFRLGSFSSVALMFTIIITSYLYFLCVSAM